VAIGDVGAVSRQAGSTYVPKVRRISARSDVLKVSADGVNRPPVRTQ
jgi:hypothetical protein